MKFKSWLSILVAGCVAALAGATLAASPKPLTDTSLPAKPILSRVAPVSLFEIDLHWRDKSTNEDGFIIERSTTDRTNFRQIAQLLPGTTIYRDKNLFPGTRYFYRLRAFNSTGSSGFSADSARTPAPVVPMTIAVWGDTPGFATNAPDVVSISEGYSHVLELRKDGTVIGFGENSFGQASPPTNLTGVVAIAAGDEFSLALKNDGSVVQWGNTNIAQPPAEASNLVAISAGGAHVLALRGDGTVVGWGDNSAGQATPPANLTGVVAIAAGYSHSLALTSDGRIIGWGFQDSGTVTPTNATDIVAIAANFERSFAVRSDGTVVAWGDNYFGAARPPTNLTGVADISAGYTHTIALTKDGTVSDWGEQNIFGAAYSAPDFGGGAAAISTRGFQRTALTLSPASPSDMKAIVISPTQIQLFWRDNATDEKGFQLERAPAGLPVEWAQIAVLGPNKTNYTDKTLTAGSVYLYRVRAFNTFGTSPYYQQLAVNTSLSPPDGFSATLGNGKVDLAWALNFYQSGTYTWGGVDGVKIERTQDNGGAPGTWSEIASVTATNYAFVDSTIATNTSYWYRARSFNSLSFSPYTGAVLVGVVPPLAPFLGANVSKNFINLFWYANNIPTPAEGFKLERAPDVNGVPGAWIDLANGLTNFTSYVDGPFAGNTTNWYRVRAYNWVGDSPYGDPVQAVIQPTADPFGLAASVGLTQNVHLVWYAGGDEDGFELERAPDVSGSPGTWSQIAVLNDTNIYQESFNDTNVVGDTTYWYRVRAYSILGFSDYAASVQFTTTAPALAPWNLTVMMADRVRLYWSYSSAISAGFAIERAPDTNGVPGAWTEIGSLIPTNSTSGGVSDYLFIDTNVTGNAISWYRVRAFNWVGYSDYSDAPPVSLFPPEFRFGFSLHTYRHTVQIVWAESLGKFGWYEIERAPDVSGAPGAWTLIATPSGDNNYYEDTGLVSNTRYWYRIRAANWVGYSAYATASSITIVPPSAPIGLACQIGLTTNSVELSWADFGDEDGFRIERAADSNGAPGVWTEISVLNASNAYSATVTDTNVTGYVTNWYRVRAFNDIGDSDYSAPVSIAIFPPETPRDFAAFGYAPNRIDLIWGDYDFLALGYKLERAPDAGGVPGPWLEITNISDGNNSSYSDTTVTAGDTYWYRVRAYNWVGESTNTDPVSVAVPVPPDSGPPQILSLRATNGGMLVQWSTLAGSTDTVQAASNPSGTYSNISPPLIIGGSGNPVATYLDPGALTNVPVRFYRIQSSR